MQKSLKVYLQSQISVQKYFQIIQEVIENIWRVRNQGEQIVLQMEEMTYDEGHVGYKTVSEDSVIELNTVRDFVRKMTFASVFCAGEDFRRVSEFLRFMEDVQKCQRLQDLYEYCVDENYDPEEMQKVQSVQPEFTEPDEAGETGVLDVAFWDTIGQPQISQGPESDETGILDPSYWNQMGSGHNPAGSISNTKPRREQIQITIGKLVSVLNGREIVIQHNDFWIGKENVDFIIEKPTVSRRHAVIKQNGTHFFIADNGSTNKTYVENKAIPPKALVEIFNGTKIKFADEEYEFHIQ